LETAYSLPSERRLESLARPIRRFVTFKSATDRRVQGGADLGPKPLTEPEADRLAADIVTISDFYSLPLDFFLGIRAMENNYMNVKTSATRFGRDEQPRGMSFLSAGPVGS
jgi:hypothetical protein